MKLQRWPLLVTVVGLALLIDQQTAKAQTSTPAPTPSPLVPGRNANSNFKVDGDAELPWPLPLPPTFTIASATPTLYNATPAHATGYPNQAGTATAQVGSFTGPVNAIATPVAGLIGTGPTPSGGELNTGVDLGTGTVTFIGFAEELGDSLGPIVGTGKAFALGLLDLGDYSPSIVPIMTAEIVVVVIAAFLALLLVIIKAGNWLINFVIKVVTMIGSFVG